MADSRSRSGERRKQHEEELPSSYPGSFTRSGRYGSEYDSHLHSISSRFNAEYEERRDMDSKHEQYVSGADKDGIRVEFCDFYPRQNAREHHTEMYELVHTVSPRPVLRRGQVFRMSIKLRDRRFYPDSESIKLIFTFGSNPSVPKDTKVVLPLTASRGQEFERGNDWEMRIMDIEDMLIHLEVYVSPDAPVGVWQCYVESISDVPNKNRHHGDSSQEKRQVNASRDRSSERRKFSANDDSPVRYDKESDRRGWDNSNHYPTRNSYCNRDTREFSSDERGKKWHEKDDEKQDFFKTQQSGPRQSQDTQRRRNSLKLTESSSSLKDNFEYKDDANDYNSSKKRTESPHQQIRHRKNSPHDYKNTKPSSRKDSPRPRHSDPEHMYENTRKDGYSKYKHQIETDDDYKKENYSGHRNVTYSRKDDSFHYRDKIPKPQNKDSYRKYRKESSPEINKKYIDCESSRRRDGSVKQKDDINKELRYQSKKYASAEHEHAKRNPSFTRSDNFYHQDSPDPFNTREGAKGCSDSEYYQDTRNKETDSNKVETVKQLYKCKQDLYILFNPWCKDDSTYMQSKEGRKEYILNENGKIWTGSYRRNRGRHWVYGQFDHAVLPAVMYLLERAEMGDTERSNPVRVVRAISEMVHTKDYEHHGKRESRYDDNCLMIGRWDGNYDDGVSPFCWTGSVGILEQYLRTGKPVKYGQCWVFAAVTTTICRALGIPCRPVTNFVSSHDTNNSLTIDRFFRKSLRENEIGPEGDSWDSVWSFHCWNDVWMSRPDLPSGYEGWQAIDSTYQEESDGKSRCGPASLESIRRGQIGFCYDTLFLFTELNARINHWLENRKTDWGFSKAKAENYKTGRHILTKRVDLEDDERDEDVEDVVYQYKARDGTFFEFDEIKNALQGMNRRYNRNKKTQAGVEDVECNLLHVDKTSLGNPFVVTLELTNRSNEQRTVDANLLCDSIFYTGVKNRKLKQKSGKVVLKSNQHESFVMNIEPEDYQDSLVDHCLLKFYAMVNVRETGQVWGEEDDFSFEWTRLAIKSKEKLRVNRETEISFRFTNPLYLTLTNCRFSFEGAGLQRPLVVKFRDVKPGESVTHTETFLPRMQGNVRLVANFTSHQLSDINASTRLEVGN